MKSFILIIFIGQTASVGPAFQYREYCEQAAARVESVRTVTAAVCVEKR